MDLCSHKRISRLFFLLSYGKALFIGVVSWAIGMGRGKSSRAAM